MSKTKSIKTAAMLIAERKENVATLLEQLRAVADAIPADGNYCHAGSLGRMEEVLGEFLSGYAPRLSQDEMTIWFPLSATRDAAVAHARRLIGTKQSAAVRVVARKSHKGFGLTAEYDDTLDLDEAIGVLMRVAKKYEAIVEE